MSGWDQEAYDEALAEKDKRIAELENQLSQAKSVADAYSDIATKLTSAFGAFVQQVRHEMKLIAEKITKVG